MPNFDTKYQLMLMAMGVVTATVCLLGMWRTNRPVLWFLIMATTFVILAGVYFGYLSDFFRERLGNLDENLPDLFHETVPWFIWLILFALAALYLTTWLVYDYRKSLATDDREAPEAQDFADLELAWEEIVSRLDSEDEIWRTKPLFLMLSPSEEQSRAILDSRDLVVDQIVPADEKAPVPAYRSNAWVFLSVAGATSYGTADGKSRKRFEWVCTKIRSLDPERPPVRGITIVVPFAEVRAGQSLSHIGAVRSDLAAVAVSLGLDCPVLVAFAFDEQSYFSEYAHRARNAGPVGRIGFSYPYALRSDPEQAQHGFQWLAKFIGLRSTAYMFDDLLDSKGNQTLLRLQWELRRASREMGKIIASACTTISNRYEPMLRGCYLISVGRQGESAFMVPLFKGEKCKAMTEAGFTSWSAAAYREARTYRRWSLYLLLGSFVLLAPLWYWGIWLRENGVDFWHAVILAAIALGWGLVFLWRSPRQK
jgi:hypothetical protein